jgi:hypothetical protein
MHAFTTRIVCSAVKNGDVMLVGVRHWDPLMVSQAEALKELLPEGEWEEGFITQHMSFVNRKEALKIAKSSGQSLDMVRNRSEDELYSEGVW